MALAFVGTASSGMTDTSGTTLSTGSRAGVTAGNLLLAWAKHEGAPTTISVSDGTTTFTPATKTNHTNTDLSGQWHYLLASVASGTVTYTMTLAAARPYRSLIVFECSYTGSLTFDTENSGQSTTGTNPNSGNITTTGTDEVVVGGYGEYSPEVANTGECNNLAATSSHYMSSPNFTAAWGRIFTATFTGLGADCSISSSNAWLCNCLAIKAGAAAAVGLPPLVMAPYLRR